MIRKAAVLTIAALFVASAAFAAPDKGKKSKTTDVMTCPMTGEKATKGGGTTKYGKYVVHFCCPSCKPGFEKLSKAEKNKKIAAALKKKTAETTPTTGDTTKLVDVMTCPVTGEKVIGEGGGSVVVGKYNVHFCCAGCKSPFEKLTTAEKEEKIQAALKKG